MLFQLIVKLTTAKHERTYRFAQRKQRRKISAYNRQSIHRPIACPKWGQQNILTESGNWKKWAKYTFQVKII